MLRELRQGWTSWLGRKFPRKRKKERTYQDPSQRPSKSVLYVIKSGISRKIFLRESKKNGEDGYDASLDSYGYDNSYVLLITNCQNQFDWVLDSCCSHHTC